MYSYLKFFITLLLICYSTLSWGRITLQNQVSGIKEPLLTEVNAYIASKQDAIAAPLTSEKIKLFQQSLLTDLNDFFQARGYFKTRITSALTQQGQRWNAHYQIILGLPVRITQIEIKVLGGAAAVQRALQNFPLREGDVFTTEQYTNAKQFLFNQANIFGYLKARLSKTAVFIDRNKYTVCIKLVFDLGPRYRFGEVHFSATPFSQSFLRRFVPFEFGEWYGSDKVKKLQDSLTNSNLFSTVTIAPKVSVGTNDEVPVEVNLIPRKARQYNFGVGYGTDTGWRGLLGLELRHLTANGQSFAGFAKLSEVQNSVEAHYLIPGEDPVTERYELSTLLNTQNQTYGSSNTLKAAGSYVRNWRRWQMTAQINVLREHYNLTDQPIRHAALIMPSVNLLHSFADNPVQPTTGHRLSLNVQGASAAVASTASFLQMQADSKYLTFLGKNTQLVTRGVYGITAIDDLDKLPLSLQYFAGGIQSVRGYGYKSIGPGRNLVVGSVELRQRIFGEWFGTAFIDMGNTSSSFFPSLKKGAGVGILCNSPLGPVQFSYAKALSLPGTPSRIQFSIGPEF